MQTISLPDTKAYDF
jgi:outer membrane protein assembly factor BamB